MPYYHIPLHDSWRPNDVAEALRELGVQSHTNDDRVEAVVPILGFVDPDKIIAATTLEELTPKKLGETNVTLSFCHETVIDNISIDFDFDFLLPLERHPDFSCLRKALQKCGYICGSRSEILQYYVPDDSDACNLIDEIEALQLEKENLVANQDYAGAKAVFQKERELRTKLDNKIRNLPWEN